MDEAREARGAGGEWDPRQGERREWAEHGRRLRHDAEAMKTDLGRAASDARDVVRRSLEENPYGTLAVAAAAGYVLAGGLASGLSRLLLRTGGRIAVGKATASFFTDGSVDD